MHAETSFGVSNLAWGTVLSF